MTLPADPAELLALARRAATAAAAQALAWQREPGALLVEEKEASDDLVSQADRAAERAAVDVLLTGRPDDAVLGEESGAVPGTTGVRWAVDPIDGTTSYLYGRPDWAVSVAAVAEADGRVLAGVVAEPALARVTEAALGSGTWSDGRRVQRAGATDLRRALVEVNLGRPEQRPLAGALFESLAGRVRDVRRGGRAAAAMAQVATGRSEAYWGPGLREWDGAAGMLLVAEAGGTVGDLSGPAAAVWPADGDVLATADGLFDELLAVLAPVYARRVAASR